MYVKKTKEAILLLAQELSQSHFSDSRGGAISLISVCSNTKQQARMSRVYVVLKKQGCSSSTDKRHPTLMSLVLSENEIKHEVLVGIRTYI